MEYIAQNGNRVRLADIAEATQLEKTTVHNFLKTLTALGYVEQEELSPRYQLTSRIHRLCPPEIPVVELKQRFRPILQELTELTGETSYLSVQMGTYFRHELKCEPDRAVRISLELGKEFAMINTAIGKIFMAHSPHLRNILMKDVEPARRARLLEELGGVLKLGYAEDLEDFQPELNCVAVPLFSKDRLVAVIGVSGPAFRFKTEEMRRAIALLKAAAKVPNAAIMKVPAPGTSSI